MSESELKEVIRALASDLRPVEREPFLAGLRRPGLRLRRHRPPGVESLRDVRCGLGQDATLANGAPASLGRI